MRGSAAAGGALPRALLIAAIAGCALAPLAAAPPPAVDGAAPPAAPGRSYEAVVGDADAAYARDDYKAARPLYAEAVRLRPDALHPLARLARLESWDGALAASIGHYHEALRLAPQDTALDLELAKVLAWDRQYGASIARYEDLRGRHPDDPRVLLGLGETLAWAGRYADADAVYLDMERRQIEPLQAHLGRARVRAWQEDLAGATDFYRDVLKAEPGNLPARIGLAQVNHWRGQDRAARAQVDNIVLDHPESREAQALRAEIHDALRPSGAIEGFRFSDNESNRVDSGSLWYSFMAEPQTFIRVTYANEDATWRCDAATFCNEPGTLPGDEVQARAQTLVGGVDSHVFGPIQFHARIGVARETSFDGGSRDVLIGGGFIRWQVGPRYAVTGTAERDALLDTALLIDRGIKVDVADLRMEFRYRPRWMVFGNGGFGLYSDGNVRYGGSAGIEWRIRPARPRVTGTFVAAYRRFQDDLDNGYFDPQHYDSELAVLALADDYRHSFWFWQVEGTYGRQGFTASGEDHDDTVQGIYAAAGIRFLKRMSLEAYYWRSDYALQLSTGFTSTKTGFAFRMKM